MERRTTFVWAVICTATLAASIGCGGKNPAEPTRGAASAPGGATGADGDVSALATTSMKWTLADRCTRDGYGYQWRLFDMVTKKRYPTSGYYRTYNGGTKSVVISCTTNHKICIGGTTYPTTSYQFGVGTKGTRRATSLFCKPCSPIIYKLTYSCPSIGLAPGEDDWSVDESGLGDPAFLDSASDVEEDSVFEIE